MVGKVITALNILYMGLIPMFWENVSAIDCFKCFSFNKSDPDCGDPFHSAYGEYIKDCRQGQNGHVGLYPAKYCIKLIGNSAKDDIEMVYRSCSLESLDSQCGEFRYEDVQYNGCIMSCTEDGCNTASTSSDGWWTVIISSVFVMLVILKQQYSTSVTSCT